MAEPAALRGNNPLELVQQPRLAKLPETTSEVQAAVEGATTGQSIQFKGKSYAVAPTIGALPMWRFGWVAKRGLTADDMEGIAVAYEMLRDCFVITPPCEECETCLGDGKKSGPNPENCPKQDLGAWPQFEADATRKKASNEDLMEAIYQAVELISSRPTQRPSDSSAGPSTTSPNSTGSSPSPDTQPGTVTEILYRVDELIK